MSATFDQVSRGPAVVIDDRISDEPVLRRLRKEIKLKNLPMLEYDSIERATQHVQGLSSCNFIILDWKFDNIANAPIGVTVGETISNLNRKAVIDFIQQMQTCSNAPIFIFSAENAADIRHDLENAGLSSKQRQRVFVTSKKSNRALVPRIDKWVRKNPHIYLTKWWTTSWLKQNTKFFWELFEADPHWPTHFFKTFEEDGVDGRYALLEAINQMVFSSISCEDLNADLLKKRKRVDLKALRKVYENLLYTKVGIEKEVRPGDIFLKDDRYYLNIRPECDTTTREKESDHKLYLLIGKKRRAKELKKQYNPRYGIIERESQIVLLLLDGQDIVVFEKKELQIRNYSEFKTHKICRISDAFITRIRHSFASYIGRYGVPHYPNELTQSIFRRKKKEIATTNPPT